MLKEAKPLRHKHIKRVRHMHTVSLHFSPRLQYILIAVLILAGVIWGGIIADQAGIEKESSFGMLLQQMLSKEAASRGFASLMLSSFFSSSLLICISFVLGLCAVGSPGHIAITLFKGAGIGLSMGYVYLEYGMKGFFICALFILPWALITSFAIMLTCREGIRYSVMIAAAILPSGSSEKLWGEFNQYCLRHLICFLLVLIAAVIEAFSTIIFAMLFFS